MCTALGASRVDYSVIMATATLPPLPRNTALWRIEKLPLAEIKLRLQAAGLQATSTKRTLAKRLLQELQAEPEEEEATSPQSEEETPDTANEEPDRSCSGADSSDMTRSAQTPRGKRRRQTSPRTLSSSDVRAMRQMLRRHSRRYSSSPSSSSSRSSSTPSTRTSDSSSRSRTRQHRNRRTRRRHPNSNSRSRSRDRPRSGRSRRYRGRRGRHHSSCPRQGTLPPISDKLKGRIRRGEYVDLALLLHANLTSRAGGRRRSNGDSDPRNAPRQASIADFDSWIEAWSVYATVLCSFYPHLAPRLFQYQHFLALKSKSFQPKAWLRYDTEFRLKLAANDSWHFEQVDTELWVSCFAADSLASGQSAPLACYVCGSTTHLFAACPQRRVTPRQPTGPSKYDQARPQAAPGRDLPAGPTGDQQEPCFIFNDKGRCFRGNRCPYSHTCTHCGGQHARRGCPGLRPQ